MSENETPNVESDEFEQEPQEGADVGADETEDHEGEAGDFDRDRVLAKIKKLNSENRNLRQQKKEAEAKAAEEGEKSERMQALEAANSRYETLADHDLPLKLAKFITATDPERILEQAEELLSLGSSKAPPSAQPKERLRQRAQAPVADELNDLDKFSEAVFRR